MPFINKIYSKKINSVTNLCFFFFEGIQTRKVECLLQEDLSYLNDAVCAKISTKPATQQACNTQSCTPA